MSHRLTALAATFLLALSFTFITTNPAYASGKTGAGGLPDQRQFAGPERNSLVKSSKSSTITPEYNDTTCYSAPSHYNCDQEDASQTGCSNDSVTLMSTWVKGTEADPQNDLLVELRWSNHCQTNWTRITSYAGRLTDNLIADLYNQAGTIHYSDNCTNVYDLGTKTDSCLSVWTNMYYAPTENMKSCGNESFLSDPQSYITGCVQQY